MTCEPNAIACFSRLTPCSNGPRPVPVVLDELVRHRDGPYCSISSIDPPKKGIVSMSETAYIIPPSMFHSIDLAEDVRCPTPNYYLSVSHGFN
jgi:hypothetical protein